MKKWIKIILIVLFPLGMLYCIGKNLFSRSFASFLGAIFLFGLGMLLAIYLFRFDLIQTFLSYFGINA